MLIVRQSLPPSLGLEQHQMQAFAKYSYPGSLPCLATPLQALREDGGKRPLLPLPSHEREETGAEIRAGTMYIIFLQPRFCSVCSRDLRALQSRSNVSCLYGTEHKGAVRQREISALQIVTGPSNQPWVWSPVPSKQVGLHRAKTPPVAGVWMKQGSTRSCAWSRFLWTQEWIHSSSCFFFYCFFAKPYPRNLGVLSFGRALPQCGCCAGQRVQRVTAALGSSRTTLPPEQCPPAPTRYKMKSWKKKQRGFGWGFLEFLQVACFSCFSGNTR